MDNPHATHKRVRLGRRNVRGEDGLRLKGNKTKKEGKTLKIHSLLKNFVRYSITSLLKSIFLVESTLDPGFPKPVVKTNCVDTLLFEDC